MRRGVLRPYDSRSFRDDVGRSRARSLRPSGIERRSDSSRFRLFCFDRYRFSMDWANRRFRRFRRLSFGLRRPIGLFDYCSELCGNFAKVRKYSHLPTEFNNAPIITRRPWPLPDGAAVHIYFGCKNIKLQSQPGALKGRPNNIFFCIWAILLFKFGTSPTLPPPPRYLFHISDMEWGPGILGPLCE